MYLMTAFSLMCAQPARPVLAGRPAADPGSVRRAALDLLGELRDDLEQVTDHTEVGQLENRRLGVLVDHHDGLGRLHPGPVLDRAGDAYRQVQLGRDGLAGLADLELVWVPAGVGHRARRADGRAERVGELLDDAEALGPAGAASPGDHDRGFGEIGTPGSFGHD